MYLCKQEHGFSVFLRVCNLEYEVPLSLHMYKSMFRPEVIRRVELCFFRPCAKLPSLPRTSAIHHVVIPAELLFWCQRSLNFYLYKPCVMCLILLLSCLLQSGSKPRLPLSLREGPCFSLVCQDVGEPDELVVVVV